MFNVFFSYMCPIVSSFFMGEPVNIPPQPPGPIQVDKRRRVSLPALPDRPKRDAPIDLVSMDAMKRRRIRTPSDPSDPNGQVPVLKVPEVQELLGSSDFFSRYFLFEVTKKLLFDVLIFWEATFMADGCYVLFVSSKDLPWGNQGECCCASYASWRPNWATITEVDANTAPPVQVKSYVPGDPRREQLGTQYCAAASIGCHGIETSDHRLARHHVRGLWPGLYVQQNLHGKRCCFFVVFLFRDLVVHQNN